MQLRCDALGSWAWPLPHCGISPSKDLQVPLCVIWEAQEMQKIGRLFEWRLSAMASGGALCDQLMSARASDGVLCDQLMSAMALGGVLCDQLMSAMASGGVLCDQLMSARWATVDLSRGWGHKPPQ